MLFWSDCGIVPKIETSGLDGSARRVLIQDRVLHPKGMTIDYAANHLYWVDDGYDSIERSDLDGTDRFSINVKYSSTSRHYLFGIAVYQVSMRPLIILFGDRDSSGKGSRTKGAKYTFHWMEPIVFGMAVLGVLQCMTDINSRMNSSGAEVLNAWLSGAFTTHSKTWTVHPARQYI